MCSANPTSYRHLHRHQEVWSTFRTERDVPAEESYESLPPILCEEVNALDLSEPPSHVGATLLASPGWA